MILTTTKALCCSCDTEKFESAIESADEIFVGSIVKAEKYQNGHYLDKDDKEVANYNWKFHFEVKEKWKGSTSSNVIVYLSGTTCDFYFDIFKRQYLVYASKQFGKNIFGISTGPSDGENRLTAWLCSRTTPNRSWSDDDWFTTDIEQLNKTFPDKVKLQKPLPIQICLAIPLIALLIGVFYWMKKKRKRT